jgi:hypothetical protein
VVVTSTATSLLYSLSLHYATDEVYSSSEAGSLLELPVQVGPSDLSMAQGVFEMHGAFPSLRGLSKLAQIGDLGHKQQRARQGNNDNQKILWRIQHFDLPKGERFLYSVFRKRRLSRFA